MPVISPSGGSGEPTVSVTRPKSSPQARVAFNALLSRAIGLADFSHLAIDHDPTTQTLTFIPCKTKKYGAALAYALVADGGGRVDARAVYVRKTAVTFLPTGPYEPKYSRRGRPFSITYEVK